MTVAELIAKLELDASQFVTGVKQSLGQLDQLEAATSRASNQISAMGARLGTMPAALRASAKASEEKAKSLKSLSQAIQDNERGFGTLQNRLSAAAGTNNELIESFGLMADRLGKLGGAFKIIGTAGLAVTFFEISRALGQLISDFSTFGTTYENWQAKIQTDQQDERSRLAARAVVMATITSSERNAAIASAEASAVRLRASGDEFNAIRLVADARRKDLDAEQKQAEGRLRDVARASAGRIAGAKGLAAIAKDFAARRLQLEEETVAALNKADADRFAKRLEHEEALLALIQARAKAESDALQIATQRQAQLIGAQLAMERGRKTPGALPQVESTAASDAKLDRTLSLVKRQVAVLEQGARQAAQSRLRDINAESRRQISEWQRQVDAGTLLFGDFEARRTREQERAGALRRVVEETLQSDLVKIRTDAQRQVMAEEQAAFDRSLKFHDLMRDLAQERSTAELDAAAIIAQSEGRIAEASAIESRKRFDAIRTEAEGRMRAVQLMVRDGVLNEQQAGAARLAIIENTSKKTIAALNAEAERRREILRQGAGAEESFGVKDGFLGGLTKIDDFARRTNAFTQAMAELVRGGTPIEALFGTISKVTDAAGKEFDELRVKFKDSPELLAELDRRGRAFRFGDVIQQIRDTARTVQDLGRNLGPTSTEVGSFAGTVQTQIPTAVAVAIPWLQSLAQWFDYVGARAAAAGQQVDNFGMSEGGDGAPDGTTVTSTRTVILPNEGARGVGDDEGF